MGLSKVMVQTDKTLYGAGKSALCPKTAFHITRINFLKKIFSTFRGIYGMQRRFIYSLKTKTDIWTIEGKMGGVPQGTLRILFAGPEIDKNYFTGLAFENGKASHVGKVSLWGLRALKKKLFTDCGLAIFRLERDIYTRFFSEGNRFYIPGWVGGSTGTAVPDETHSRKNDIRKIKKYKFSYEVTQDEARFDDFYARMYLPYINGRYGNRAFLMSYQEMKKGAEICELMLVKKDGEYVAGNILVYEGDTARLWSLGIKDGRDDLIRTGVRGVTDYFCALHLRQKGYERMHYGYSRAFVNDGVLQFKKARGMSLIKSFPDFGFVITPLADSTCVRSFFSKNPFIFLNNQGRLEGAVFPDEKDLGTTEDFNNIFKNSYIDGMDRINLFLSGENKNSQGHYEKTVLIPAAIKDKIAVRSADTLFKN